MTALEINKRYIQRALIIGRKISWEKIGNLDDVRILSHQDHPAIKFLVEAMKDGKRMSTNRLFFGFKGSAKPFITGVYAYFANVMKEYLRMELYKDESLNPDQKFLLLMGFHFVHSNGDLIGALNKGPEFYFKRTYSLTIGFEDLVCEFNKSI